MGFSNYHINSSGRRKYEVCIYSSIRGLLKVLKTDTEIGLPVLTESAKSYVQDFIKENPKENYRIELLDNSKLELTLSPKRFNLS